MNVDTASMGPSKVYVHDNESMDYTCISLQLVDNGRACVNGDRYRRYGTGEGSRA